MGLRSSGSSSMTAAVGTIERIVAISTETGHFRCSGFELKHILPIIPNDGHWIHIQYLSHVTRPKAFTDIVNTACDITKGERGDDSRLAIMFNVSRYHYRPMQ